MSYVTIENGQAYQMNPPDAREGDQCYSPSLESWQKCSKHEDGVCGLQRRRLISPGEGFRIVGVDEAQPKEFEVSEDGITWNKGTFCSHEDCQRVECYLKNHGAYIAIRVRIEQDKGQESVYKGETWTAFTITIRSV
jgi:hypothetical protein